MKSAGVEPAPFRVTTSRLVLAAAITAEGDWPLPAAWPAEMSVYPHPVPSSSQWKSAGLLELAPFCVTTSSLAFAASMTAEGAVPLLARG